MRIDRDTIISEFKLIHFGAKGWMRSDNIPCPECGRKDKFGILFTNNGESGVTHCFYNCSDNLSLFSFLRKIGRGDLIEYERAVHVNKLKKPSFLYDETDDEIEESKIALPVGYERIYFDSYLFGRNFKSYQYDQFEVGITKHFLEKKLHDHLIFVLKQKGEIVGWLARSKKSYKWHKRNLERSKLGLEQLSLRYENSKGTDFTKILGGIDEITDETEEVILVEGLFDKTNVSNLLEDEYKDVKVCFTFGNKVSVEQMDLLREFPNLKRIILMYDQDALVQIRQYGAELLKYFDVEICSLPLEYNEKGDIIDPGNANKNFISRIMKNRKNFIYFYTSKLNFKKFNQ